MIYLIETVTSAEYVSEYKLKLGFSDGSLKIVDLEPRLTKGLYLPLRDVEYFRTFRLDEEAGTIVWDNGADVAPETLYSIGVDVTDVA